MSFHVIAKTFSKSGKSNVLKILAVLELNYITFSGLVPAIINTENLAASIFKMTAMDIETQR